MFEHLATEAYSRQVGIPPALTDETRDSRPRAHSWEAAERRPAGSAGFRRVFVLLLLGLLLGPCLLGSGLTTETPGS